MAAKTAKEILDKIIREDDVRVYLRGVEAGSEIDRDAQRAMLVAIAKVRGAGVHDVMADEEPALYADACLLLCRLSVDAEDAHAADIKAQYFDDILLLRGHEKNIDEEEVTENE